MLLSIWTATAYILCIYRYRKTIVISSKSYIIEVTKSNAVNYCMCWFVVKSSLLWAVPASAGARFVSLIIHSHRHIGAYTHTHTRVGAHMHAHTCVHTRTCPHTHRHVH